MLLNCAGCRLIGRTLNYTLNLAVQLLPFLLLVSIDEDMNGDAERTESYVAWVDPHLGVTEVRGQKNATTSLQVSSATHTAHGWILDLVLPSSEQKLQMLVPTSGEPITHTEGTVKLTARLADTWQRESQSSLPL